MFGKLDVRRKSIVTLALLQDCRKIFCKSGPSTTAAVLYKQTALQPSLNATFNQSTTGNVKCNVKTDLLSKLMVMQLYYYFIIYIQSKLQAPSPFSPEEEKEGYGGKDLQKRKVLRLE